MKFLFLIILSISFSVQIYSQVRVSGYYRKNGTYVQPHYRSSPDGNPYNNWSYPGNVNPYTGKVATGNPSTYLYNYYNRSSTYTPTYTYPSTSTYTPTYTTPTYSNPNSYNNNTSSTYKTYYVSASNLNVRTGPSTSSSVITTLTYKDDVEIVSYADYPWYMVKVRYYDISNYSYKTTYGYAHSSYLSNTYPTTDNNYYNSYLNTDKLTSDINKLLTNPSNASSSYNTYSNSTSYYVTSNKLNVRSGPSTSNSILTTLDFQDKIDVISTYDYPWYKIKVSYYDNEDYSYKTAYGYIHSSYISNYYPTYSSSDYSNSYNTTTKDYSTTLAQPITYHPYGEGKGKISVWTDCTNDGYISIYIDDVYSGQLTSYFTSKPDCNSVGTLSIIKPAGYYKVTAKGSTKKWEGYVTITSDECQTQKLSK